MTTQDGRAPGGNENTQTRYKRRMRNYLLDAGLQLRYTAAIVVVAVLLTAVLGYMMYQATRDTSRIIMMTELVDPAAAAALSSEFANQDRTVLWGILGFGVVLVLSVTTAGILITHKIAGPLYNIARTCRRVRENRLGPPLRHLRKGDELQEFFSEFRDMHEALRQRVDDDLAALGQIAAAIERAPARTPELEAALTKLADLRKQKQESLTAE